MEPTLWHVFLDSPLRSCGLGTATVPSRFRLGIVAALESLLTLLTWLLARFPHAHYRSRLAFTLTFPLQLFTFCATLLPPPFPVVRNAVRLMVHVPPDFSMHLWKVGDSNPRCPTLFVAVPRHFNPTSDLSRLPSSTQPTFLVLCAAILSQQLHIIIHPFLDILRYLESGVCPPCAALCTTDGTLHIHFLPWQNISIVIQPILRKHLELIAKLVSRQPLLLKSEHSGCHRLLNLGNNLLSQLPVHSYLILVMLTATAS